MKRFRIRASVTHPFDTSLLYPCSRPVLSWSPYSASVEQNIDIPQCRNIRNRIKEARYLVTIRCIVVKQVLTVFRSQVAGSLARGGLGTEKIQTVPHVRGRMVQAHGTLCF
jgi:hypothetical protein